MEHRRVLVRAFQYESKARYGSMIRQESTTVEPTSGGVESVAITNEIGSAHSHASRNRHANCVASVSSVA